MFFCNAVSRWAQLVSFLCAPNKERIRWNGAAELHISVDLLCGTTAAELHNSVDLLCGTTAASLYNLVDLLCGTTNPELNKPVWCMHQESHAFSKEKYEGLIQSKILLKV